MKKQLFSVLLLALMVSASAVAEDHVMAATRPAQKREVPAELSLSVEEAQNYAVEANRSLRNSSMAIQEAYAQRWQTIAQMLPQADFSWQLQTMLDTAGNVYKMNFGGASISLPNSTI